MKTSVEQWQRWGGRGQRALFATMCAAVQLPDIFTTTKPLVLM
ncbi:hypothetical protein E2C01_102155 [Portunus trituberculatus]|uniref:Uncharacterized protein n=1 Tax=Portunus trituberculatus TaxID=210409 RepID=A0A5B7KLX4_PORTR|nr:hypothetical protein [Portunus trituberculatus]